MYTYFEFKIITKYTDTKNIIFYDESKKFCLGEINIKTINKNTNQILTKGNIFVFQKYYNINSLLTIKKLPEDPFELLMNRDLFGKSVKVLPLSIKSPNQNIVLNDDKVLYNELYIKAFNNGNNIISVYGFNNISPFKPITYYNFLPFDFFNLKKISENIFRLTSIPPWPHSKTSNGYSVYFTFKNDYLNINYIENIIVPIQTNFSTCNVNNLDYVNKNAINIASKVIDNCYLINSNNPEYIKIYMKDVNDYSNIFYSSIYLWDHINEKISLIFRFDSFYNLFKDFEILPVPSHTFDYFIYDNIIYIACILQQQKDEAFVICVGKKIDNNVLQTLANDKPWDYYFYYKTKKPNNFSGKSHSNGITILNKNNKFYIITTDRNGYVSFNELLKLNIKSETIITPNKQSCFKIRFDKKNYPTESDLREVHNIFHYENLLYLFGNARATIVKIDFNNPNEYFNEVNKNYEFITTNLSNRINNQINTNAVYGSISRINNQSESFLLINQGTTGQAKSCENFGSKIGYIANYNSTLDYYGGYQKEILEVS